MNLASPAPETRGDAARLKLLTASVLVFGEHGFHGTSTRMLAESAGVNLQAIAYYFGGKDGLYAAAAEHVATIVSTRQRASRDAATARLDAAAERGTRLPVREARVLLVDMLVAMAAVFVSEDMRPASQFILREHMEPSNAFQQVFQLLFRPQFTAVTRLVAVLLKDDAPQASPRVRLRSLALMGGVMIFRSSRAGALAQMGWSDIGPDEFEAIREMVTEMVAAV